MHVRHSGLVVMGLVALASVVVAVADGDAAAVKKCKATQVALTVSGKRTCVPRTQFRPTRSPRSEVAAFVGDALARPINAVRKRDKRRVVLRVRPALAARMTAKTVELEAVLRSAVQAALAAKTNDRAEVNGAPGVTITQNADGSATGSISASVTSGGDTGTVGASLTGKNVGGQVELELGVDVTLQQQGGSTSSFGFTIGGLGGPGTDTCPNADGVIRLDDTVNGAVRGGNVVKVGAANLATFRSSATFSGKVTATARMSPDANLTPFRFAISQKFDIAVSTRALAFINMQQRVVATGSLTGTIEPASGQITGAAATINVVMSGISKDDAVATRTKARIDLEKSLRDQAGRLLKEAKEVEKRAQDGECTRLIFNPATPGDLAPNGNVNVTSRLETVQGGSAVEKVKWTATATKGSVSPASASTAQPSWTITGAADGPEVARIPVRAVSPAGISEVPWVGGLTFPRTYSGSVSLRKDLFGNVEDWQGNFTWVRSSIQQNPDKSQLVRYTLTSGTVGSFTAVVPIPMGSCSGAAPGPSGTVVFGDLEVFVDPAGAWRSAFVVDVDVADFPTPCIPPPSPPTLYPAKAVLNSRQMPGSLLRPMSAGGPIAATNVTDVGLVAVTSSTASWNLQPGN